MAKKKIVMLPGSGGEWNVNNKPWGQVSGTTAGSRSPTSGERKVIKNQVKTFDKRMSKSNRSAGIK